MLAAAMALLMCALFFVIDYPPDAAEASSNTARAGGAKPAAGPLTMGQLTKTYDFWAISVAWSIVTTASIVIWAHLVPMVKDWGISATQAVSLLSIANLTGMIGTPLSGWLADRVTGVRVLILLCINMAILWAVTLLQPSYIFLVIIAALLGIQGTAARPAFDLAAYQRFGPANYARVAGLCHTVALLPHMAGVPIFAHVYVKTGSYAGAVVGLCVVCVLTGLLVAHSLTRGKIPSQSSFVKTDG
jgi:nitrate/nitrite transporter NarK